MPPTDETVPGASTPVPDEPRAERPGDAPDGGSEREETYDEGQAVAEAAALLKPKLEKKEKITSEQVGDTRSKDSRFSQPARDLQRTFQTISHELS